MGTPPRGGGPSPAAQRRWASEEGAPSAKRDVMGPRTEFRYIVFLSGFLYVLLRLCLDTHVLGVGALLLAEANNNVHVAAVVLHAALRAACAEWEGGQSAKTILGVTQQNSAGTDIT